jgi:membrane-associated phospholipid phosphatase
VRESDVTKADRARRRWATAISNVTMPPIVASLTFVLVNYAVSGGLSFVALTLLTTLVAVLPFGVVTIGALSAGAHEINVDEGAWRRYWLLLSTVSYFVGTAVLLLIRAPLLVAVVAFGFGAVMLVIFIINLRWKISGHSMGVAVPTTTLAFVFGPWGLLCGLLLPPVMWSRVYLRKHTVAQVLAGALVSFALMGLILALLLP